MQTLTRALRQNDGIGEPLPVVFPTLNHKGWVLRRAQVVMIAAAPNVGKSALALSFVVNLGLPTLYLSADTDPFTMILRSAAIATGDTLNHIERALQAGGAAYYESVLDELDHLRFVFDPGPTLEDIDLEVSAFNEVYGTPPEIIVVDSMMNVQCDDGDEFRSLRIVEQALHQLARTTGACVIVLHHVTGEWEDGQEPPPRRAINGKISRRIETILTLGKSGEFLGIACVKNRGGPSDPLAGNSVWFHCDFDRMSINDPLLKGQT